VNEFELIIKCVSDRKKAVAKPMPKKQKNMSIDKGP
jgi:hypothetical protein